MNARRPSRIAEYAEQAAAALRSMADGIEKIVRAYLPAFARVTKEQLPKRRSHAADRTRSPRWRAGSRRTRRLARTQRKPGGHGRRDC
jgi:hypothetical protein